MSLTETTLTLETGAAQGVLSALSEAAERLPEFRDALVDLIEAGEQIFSLQVDGGSASSTGHLVVRLDPSDGLVGLVSAFRARNSDLSLLEHALSSLSDKRIAEEHAGVESDG